MSNNIQESIFNAIDVITDKKINDIKFDKTIECIIENDGEADKGKYTARYQDIIINIFSSNNTVKYRKGENVYVLVPQGDFSNKKTIIGKVDSSGEEFISIDSIIDKIEILEENYVDEPKDSVFKWEPGDNLIRELAFKNEKFITNYAGKLNLLIGATIKSKLEKESGDFGLRLDLTFRTKKGEEINHAYEVNLNSMIGNPYSLNNRYQYKIFPLLTEDLIRVNGMYLFVKGFSGDKGTNFIEFGNVEVSYAKPKDAADLDTFSAKIKAEQGTVFKNGLVNQESTLTLEMMPEKQGKAFKPNAVYKWFFSDSTVQTNGDGWDIDGGKGWRYINPPVAERGAEQLKGLSVSKDGKVLTVQAKAVPNLETFKCIAIFGGETINYPDGQTQTMGVIKLDAYETIVDQSDAYNVVILSTNGDVFKPNSDITSTELICKVFMGAKELDPSRFLYSWGKYKNGKDIEYIKELDPSEKLTIEDIDDIINTENYICEVYYKYSN